MSAAATRTAAAPVWASLNRRRIPRYASALPLDVTVLRSGIPETIPGRSLDLGEAGVGAVLAGELRPGEPVGVEFRLPNGGMPMRAKALVRHQERLRCGLEFVGLDLEQQAMIRHWAQRVESQAARRIMEASPDASSPPTRAEMAREVARHARLRRILWVILAAFVLVGLLGWWQWQQAWKELESQVPHAQTIGEQAPLSVPAGVMDRLVTHRVEPLDPEKASPASAQRVVVLRAVIGPDGAVVDLKPVSGPDSLVDAAKEAVTWWRYQPYRVDGRPATVETTVAVDFPAN